ncbi:helix-turn-helix transcriptional regulator [Acidiferrimicrobium sp. IK]|uniref:helix-turn-helix domain-containing protein n=1 Tax=Acidiferrimicrobium sp. IK TaxID=2871700 RepID=UPI0021CAE446|nr:helix-turn-helix transcriptional regulator [Acidiferrimicrobium sp. IK]MCU4187183.1 helix-turn-helix transcriptional regulator [Acidiferrimicrobium sp. IK]
MKREHTYLPETLDALAALGAQIAAARRELGWTAAELAERVGVSAPLISRIENGRPTSQIGTVFEAAVLCGVALFGGDRAELASVARSERNRLALLPARVHHRPTVIVNDF